MVIYSKERHVTLRPLAWDEGVVRDEIRAIVADTEASFRPDEW